MRFLRKPIIPDVIVNQASYSSLEISNIVNKIELLPSILVKGINDFLEMYEALIEIIGVVNFYCKSSSNHLKITNGQPWIIHISDTYQTYQLKEDKPTLVVIRNIHPSTSSELIKSEVVLRPLKLGRSLTSFAKLPNIRSSNVSFLRRSRTFLNSRTTYSNFLALLIKKIKFKKLFKPISINQCHNCQDYDYTQAYCGYPARYVLCSAHHPFIYRCCSV